MVRIHTNPSDPRPDVDRLDWLGDSDMAARVRDFDWTRTPLGPVSDWSETLRTAASLCLHSRFPTALWWGDDLIAIYNEAYADYLGTGKHPEALGRPYREVWSEIWADLAPLFEALFEAGEATWREDQRFAVNRDGQPEEAFFTFNLSPVVDGDGNVAGALNVVAETTGRVVANRRMQTLQRAGAASAGTSTVRDAGAAIGLALASHTADVPFSALYWVVGDELELVGTSHLSPDSDAAPTTLRLDDEVWPVRQALDSREPVRVDGLGQRFDDVPGGSRCGPPRAALVIPILRGELRAVLIAGVSACRPLDDDHRTFLVSLGDTIGSALADTAAQEREHAARLDAEKANRAKSEFLTAMSHELRTPLNAIAGYVDLMDAGLHGELADGQREALERIRANQRHLLTLINDILLFARIEAARLDFETDELGALELIESLEPLIHPQALQNEIDYDIGECEDSLRVVGDRERVRQILLNLIGNAIKYTPAGGRVRVSCVADGGEAVFSVSDTGPGIPPDRQDDIFDPFSQIERRLDSPLEGAGLGLAISRDMARAMDGEVTVESEFGVGSTFQLRLPRP